MLLWLTSVALAADCPNGSTTASQVVDHAEQGTLAYAELDEDTFRAEVTAAHDAVPCLGEKVLPEDAASLHRATALLSFADDDEASALAAFRSSLRLQPNYALPTSLAAPGGPVASLYEGARVAGEATAYDLTDPDEGQVYVDGQREQQAPTGQPALLQVVRPDGSLHYSAVVWSREQVPAWFFESPVEAAPPMPAPVPMPSPEPIEDLDSLPPPAPLPQQTVRSGPSRALWLAAGVTAVGAAGLLGGSAVSRSSYERIPTASGRQTTNALYFGSVGLGVATLGLGGAALATSGGN